MSVINPHTVVLSDLPKNETKLTVMWYCGLKRNNLAPSEQKVVVGFQKPGIAKELQFLEVGITHMGQLKIGTVWQNQRLIDEKDYEEQVFDVDGSANRWQVAKTWSSISSTTTDWLIPSHVHKLQDKENCSPARVVKFSVDGNPNGLIIPCMEIFSKMYGRSHHIKKMLVNMPLSLAVDKLLYPDVQPEISNGWLVTVTRDCLNDDAVYLAHLKHDQIAYKRTDQIWHSLQKTFADSSQQFAFPVIPPWFSGKLKLKVKGRWLDSEKTRFLGLQIVGYSEPSGPDIYLDRENTNLSEIIKREGGTAYLYKRTKSPSDEISLTSDDEPGRNQEEFQVFNDPIEILGIQREVKRVIRTEREVGAIRILKNETEATGYSAGDQFGSKLHIQAASVDTPHKIVPKMFIKIWNSLQKLTAEKKIISVSSIDVSGNIIGSVETPGLIDLTTHGLPTKSTDTKEMIKWLNMGRKSHTQRKLLIAQIKTTHGDCLLLEIERKIGRT
ncbi:MAG: hypothetical protein Q8K07_09550, partial [Methylicorpusculum sp.]|uniref:hypothetical protein n=1 Tax=Methylicorpusculum sp. TaxID=2713644 RepID=UPI00272F2816